MKPEVLVVRTAREVVEAERGELVAVLTFALVATVLLIGVILIRRHS